MERIRKGNDIEIRWSIYAIDGSQEMPYNLEGKNISLFLKNQYCTVEVKDFTVQGNVVGYTYYGKDQKYSGAHSLILIENGGEVGMHTVDECDAFCLVSHSCQTGGQSEGRIESIHLQFSTNIGVCITSSTASIKVDSELSLESENPVQNKVITAALQGLATEDYVNEKIAEIEISGGGTIHKSDFNSDFNRDF